MCPLCRRRQTIRTHILCYYTTLCTIRQLIYFIGTGLTKVSAGRVFSSFPRLVMTVLSTMKNPPHVLCDGFRLHAWNQIVDKVDNPVEIHIFITDYPSFVSDESGLSGFASSGFASAFSAVSAGFVSVVSSGFASAASAAFCWSL